MSKEYINLPKTSFSMKANLPLKEPSLLEYWSKIKLYEKLREKAKEKRSLFYMMDLHTQMEIYTWAQL